MNNHQKNYISILLLFGTLVFSMLLINFNNLNFYLHTVRKRDVSSQLVDKASANIYKELECYRNLYKGLYNKSQVIKGHEEMNKFIVVAQDELKNHTHPKNPSKSNKTLSKLELRDLFKIFYFNRAFLADAAILSRTEFVDASINLKTKLSSHAIYKTKAFQQIDKYLNKHSSEAIFLTFGYKYEGLEELRNLKNDLNSNLNAECTFHEEFTKSESLSLNRNFLTGFYIHCNQLVIHLPIFYIRGAFLWISNDNFGKNYPKVFGDKHRSMNK
jgi:hypothetical protein